MQLKTEQWTDFIKIFKEFGHNLREYQSFDNQSYLWEVIINIKNNMQQEIRQAIRMNLYLCYMIEEEGQKKEINDSLFRLNHVLEQNFYVFDVDSLQGIKYFHNIISSTYGNVDKFIDDLREVKENLYFNRKRYAQLLIEKYYYLKKISLPIKGYEDLRIALLTILKKFANLKNIILNPGLFHTLLNEIDFFIEEYLKIYTCEHHNFYKNLDLFYKQLYSLPEYQALDYLSNIKAIKITNNMKPIKRYIETFFPPQCSERNFADLLEKESKCSCGYYLGHRLTIPGLNKITPMLRQGVLQYIEQLQKENYKVLFINYLGYHHDSKIRDLLYLKTDNIQAVLELIDYQLIKEINQALSNTYPLRISFDEIAGDLIGIYSMSQLELLGKEFEETIKENIRCKMEGMEKYNYDEIMINLIK